MIKSFNSRLLEFIKNNTSYVNNVYISGCMIEQISKVFCHTFLTTESVLKDLIKLTNDKKIIELRKHEWVYNYGN